MHKKHQLNVSGYLNGYLSGYLSGQIRRDPQNRSEALHKNSSARSAVRALSA
jgi:hypothetical protein